MEKMTREEIINIANNIFSESDIIGKHGTDIESAISIINTGFKFHRTSFVIQKSKSITGMCTYGWKDNAPGNAANVILSVPKEFIMRLYNMDEEKYKRFIQVISSNEDEDSVINSLSDIKIDTTDCLSPYIHGTLPNEFIRGFFVFCDNTNYLKFLKNKEEGLNHLTYVNNPNYFMELSEDKKNEVINRYKALKNEKK